MLKNKITSKETTKIDDSIIPLSLEHHIASEVKEGYNFQHVYSYHIIHAHGEDLVIFCDFQIRFWWKQGKEKIVIEQSGGDAKWCKGENGYRFEFIEIVIICNFQERKRLGFSVLCLLHELAKSGNKTNMKFQKSENQIRGWILG